MSMPTSSNPLFRPSLLDTTFQIWARKGIHCVGDLFIHGVFSSFDQLVKKYNLPRSHFFKYLQIRDFTRTQFSTFPTKSPTSALDECLKTKPYQGGYASNLYSRIQEMEGCSFEHLKAQWEEDLGSELPDTTWQWAIERIHKCSICVRHGLIQFKVVNRLHYCRAKLAHIYPASDPRCLRCLQALGT